MKFDGVHFLSAVLLVSKDPERLMHFYRDRLGMPLEDESHGGLEKHYGCELGDLHFAIHPPGNFEGEAVGVGAVKVAFEIFDMNGFVATMKERGVELLYAPKAMGPMLITAVRDPDGNLVEFTQLSEKWMSHLRKRREAGHDMLTQWERRR